LKDTFGALPNFPDTVTASDAEPDEAQASGAAVAGVDDALALVELLDGEAPLLGFEVVQPVSASGTSAAASATRRSGRRVDGRIRPS
jgi:hypothetical protein